MIVGTAGHIDHGKTSLVRALTGIDTDRLPEEKARGITLDLGFAYVPTPDGGILGFVDVPGHERLVHTMIAGASSIAMALLVVAADDGVMPQTREHLHIISLLGIGRGVVALTRTDLVDADRAIEVELEIAALLEGTALAGAAVFPVSATTGVGVDGLRDWLMEEAASDPSPGVADGRAFRLAVDRVFRLAGAGTVVTGSVVSGMVRVGDSVVVLPSGLHARVRGIHAANRAVPFAGPGERCALNLTGPGVRKDVVGRGDWVLDPAWASVTRDCDVTLRLLDGERAALRHRIPVLVHHGAGQIMARAVPLAPRTLLPGETGVVRLVLDRPVPMRHGDRLVLRDVSASRTIAGGRVLDPRPPERHRSRPARLATLAALTTADSGQALRGLLAQPPFLVRRDVLMRDWGFFDAESFAALVAGCLTLGSHVATAEAVASLTREVGEALTGFHTRAPASPGITAEALRLAMSTRLPREAFAALLAHLIASGAVVADAHWVRAPSHQAGLVGEEGRLWRALLPLLTAVPFRPPLLREAASAIGVPEVALRRACKGFSRTGLLIEMAPDRFFTRDAAIALAEAAHALAAESGDAGFTAAGFRDRVRNGRQLAIQVLDYFDRRGITMRRGDTRWAGKAAQVVFGAGF